MKDVHIAQQKFPGDRKQLLPDVIVTWTDETPPREVNSPILGTIRGLDDTGPRGHHRSEGFMITLDPDAARGTEASSMQVGEIAPMLLRQLLSSQQTA